MFNTINENIINILGIEKFPLVLQEDTMIKWGAMVYQELYAHAFTLMNKDDKELFQKMIESDTDPDLLFIYLKEKIPSIEQMSIEEALKIKQEMLQ